MKKPTRLFWLLVLGFHAVGASAWWWLEPGGFPLTHPRFWSNDVAPLVVFSVTAAAVLASRREDRRQLDIMLAFFPASWLGAALASRLVFPITFRVWFLLPLAGSVLMCMFHRWEFRERPWSAWSRGGLVASAAFGVLFLGTQRASRPATRPINSIMPSVNGTDTINGGRIGPGLFLHPGDGSLTVSAGKVRFAIHPTLRFLSRSPDGCQTILAPGRWRDLPELRLATAEERESEIRLRYKSDYESVLRVEKNHPNSPIVCEVHSRLAQRIDSHLNSYCDIEIAGHQRLAIAFSPCSQQRVEVRPSDYPFGRPLRLAYLDDHEQFHVVEATSGEKGPFRELAGGRLERSQPLGMTFYNADRPIIRVTLHDWPAQVDTTLSPTAGWGLPVNAIEFTLDASSPDASASVYITLAGTSVGRGWDSVGHNPGTYRNRLTIEVFPPQSTALDAPSR